jgi:hypothetical protein
MTRMTREADLIVMDGAEVHVAVRDRQISSSASRRIAEFHAGRAPDQEIVDERRDVLGPDRATAGT